MPDIFDLLQMNRYRLLFYISFYRGRLKDDPGVKARLAKLFGYKSDGHFYVDWDYLINEGFLVVEGGYIIATAKAQRQFSFLLLIKLIQWLSLVIAVVLIAFIAVSTFHPNLPVLVLDSNYVIGVSVGFLIAMSILARRVYKNFVPSLPSKEELRDSKV